MDGETLLVNTETDELVQIKMKDKVERWKWYCKDIIITIETNEND